MMKRTEPRKVSDYRKGRFLQANRGASLVETSSVSLSITVLFITVLS